MIDVKHGARIVSFRDEPIAAAATAIRRTLRAVFARWHLSDETVADALIVVEEMVANVVDHARTPFKLVVRRNGAVLPVAVRARCPQPIRVRTLDLERLRGRGLLMIAAIATRWGSSGDDTGKTVWAELPV